MRRRHGAEARQPDVPERHSGTAVRHGGTAVGEDGRPVAAGRPSGSAPQRPSDDFTLSPKVQPFEPSQLIDQVIRPLIELTLLYACDTSDGAM